MIVGEVRKGEFSDLMEALLVRDLLLDCLEEASEIVGLRLPRSDTLADGDESLRAAFLASLSVELGVATTIPDGMGLVRFSGLGFFRGIVCVCVCGVCV